VPSKLLIAESRVQPHNIFGAEPLITESSKYDLGQIHQDAFRHDMMMNDETNTVCGANVVHREFGSSGVGLLGWQRHHHLRFQLALFTLAQAYNFMKCELGERRFDVTDNELYPRIHVQSLSHHITAFAVHISIQQRLTES
jgi:hypothetical protein